MSKFSWIALVALLGAFVVSGCYADEEVEAEGSAVSTDTDVDGEGHDEGDTDGESHEDDDDDSAMADTGMTLASDVHQNDDGVAICPVMGSAIPDVSRAVGEQKYEGKTYYFC